MSGRNLSPKNWDCLLCEYADLASKRQSFVHVCEEIVGQLLVLPLFILQFDRAVLLSCQS